MNNVAKASPEKISQDLHLKQPASKSKSKCQHISVAKGRWAGRPQKLLMLSTSP